MFDPVQQALEQIAGPRWQTAPGKGNERASNRLLFQPMILETSLQGAAQKLARQGFTRCHWFGVLPSRKAPRWLLPLGSSAVIRQSLEICAAYSLRARAMKSLLFVMTRMNWLGWARSRVILAGKEPLPLEALVSEVTGEMAPVFALSIGRPHRHRKVVIQVMRPTGEILGYIKLPLTRAAKERVRHEAAMLGGLRSFVQLRPHIPRVLHAGEWGDSYVLFQSSGPADIGPLELGRAHEEFLLLLQTVCHVVKPGRAIAAEVQSRWQRLELRLDAELRELGRIVLARARQQLNGTSVRCGIHHGDFAPWNTRVRSGRLFLFDWESASLEAPVCWDAFHFRVQVEGLLKKKGDGRWVESLGESHKPELLLYLLNSLCQLLEEDPEDRTGIEYRLKLLRESVRVCPGDSWGKLLRPSWIKTPGGSAPCCRSFPTQFIATQSTQKLRPSKDKCDSMLEQGARARTVTLRALEATTDSANGHLDLPISPSAAWIRKGILAVLDQGLIAGSNFLVGVLLARWLAPEQYGAYALAFSVFLLLFQLYHSFVLEPMSVFGGSEYRDCLRGYLKQLLWLHLGIVLIVFLALGLCAGAGRFVQSSDGLPGALAGVTIAGPCVLLLWLARGACYVRVAPKAAAAGAVLYCASLLAGLFLLDKRGWLSPFTAFVLMGVGALFTSVVLLTQLNRSLPADRAAPGLKNVWRRHWCYGRWALASSVSTWIPTNICFPILTAFSGIASAGELKALLNLGLPLGHTATALSLLLQSYAARVHRQVGVAGVRNLTLQITQLLAAGAFVYWAGLVLFGPEVVRSLYGGNYGAIARLMPWLAFASILQVAICGPAIGLRAMESPASVFLAYLASSAVAVFAGIPLAWKLGAQGIVIGMILSNLFAVTVAFALLRRKQISGAVLPARVS